MDIEFIISLIFSIIGLIGIGLIVLACFFT